MKLLAFDTTAAIGSVALLVGDRIIDEWTVEAPDGFGHVLFPKIEALLSKHSESVTSIDGFVAASGPGSFTGVRVGLTAAKGLAAASGKPMAAISNLQALAAFGTADLRGVVIDARRNQVYVALYNAQLRLLGNEAVMPLQDWIASVWRDVPGADARGEFEWITQSETIAAAVRVETPGWRVILAPPAIAGQLGKIAARAWGEALWRDPAEWDANYVRRSDAELFWKEP